MIRRLPAPWTVDVQRTHADPFEIPEEATTKKGLLVRERLTATGSLQTSIGAIVN
jgi:hypothetical protein